MLYEGSDYLGRTRVAPRSRAASCDASGVNYRGAVSLSTVHRALEWLVQRANRSPLKSIEHAIAPAACGPRVAGLD